MAFETVVAQPPDPLLSAIGLFNADPRPGKIDLGVGVFRTEEGLTPVLRCVKAAEARLLDTQQTKAYVGQSGDLRFVELMGELVFGAGRDRHRRGMQTTGGTGALRIAAEVLALSGVAAVHVGRPAWANHLPILKASGVRAILHAHFDPFGQRVAFADVAEALSNAARGEAVLLQAACHNPTGADFSLEQWRVIAGLVADRGLVPFIDVAYPGLGEGIDEDLAGARLVLDSAQEALVAVSGAKSFGLYRERVGALFVQAASAERATAVESNMLAVARTMYSMPPDHGAAIVRTVLDDAGLRQEWLAELAEMRSRINGLRARLSAVGQIGRIDFSGLAAQRGMFSLLPLSTEQIDRLREDHAVHVVDSGRINLAGLRSADIEPLLRALRASTGLRPASGGGTA